MERQFAEKMVEMANGSLKAIREGYIGSGDEYSYEVGYMKGLIAAVEYAGYKVTRDYSDKNALFILG